MLLRLLFLTALVLLASLTMPPSHAMAQTSDRDQPGMIPDPADEQLDPRLQRQIVFFRSNEPPGTIIVVSVSTSNGPLRTVSGLLSVRWNRGLVSGITRPRAGAIRDEEHAQPCGIRIFPRRVTSRFSRRGAAK